MTNLYDKANDQMDVSACQKPVRVISVTGGKGGVGKTTLAINLALACAKLKKRVMLFDADLSLANIDVLLGLRPTKTIEHVVSGKCQLRDICVNGPGGIKVIPGGSGIQQLSNLSDREANGIIHAFSAFSQPLDILIVDTAAGISNQVLQFAHTSHDVVVVVCDDPASMTDSYALMKVLNRRFAIDRFWIVTNMMHQTGGGKKLFLKLNHLANRFLNLNLHYLGEVPYDGYVALAVKHRRAVSDEYPGARSSLAIQNMAESLLRVHLDKRAKGNLAYFFEQLIQ